MPTISQTKVGTRNREKSASVIVFGFDWAELLDENGDFYSPMVTSGLKLENGEDYEVHDADGIVVTMKSSAEKVGRLIKVEVATRLNMPTSVRLPKTGQQVSANDRQWVEFRPRVDTPFESNDARNEYIVKNGGDAILDNEFAVAIEEE